MCPSPLDRMCIQGDFLSWLALLRWAQDGCLKYLGKRIPLLNKHPSWPLIFRLVLWVFPYHPQGPSLPRPVKRAIALWKNRY